LYSSSYNVTARSHSSASSKFCASRSFIILSASWEKAVLNNTKVNVNKRMIFPIFSFTPSLLFVVCSLSFHQYTKRRTDLRNSHYKEDGNGFLDMPTDFDYLTYERHESNSKEYSHSWLDRFDRSEQPIGHS
jgi:hypothetical protein